GLFLGLIPVFFHLASEIPRKSHIIKRLYNFLCRCECMGAGGADRPISRGSLSLRSLASSWLQGLQLFIFPAPKGCPRAIPLPMISSWYNRRPPLPQQQDPLQRCH